MKYFIFGEAASDYYHDMDFFDDKQRMDLAKIIDEGGQLQIYPTQVEPEQVLADFDGWAGYAEISEDEYNILESLIIDIKTDEEETEDSKERRWEHNTKRGESGYAD